MKKKIKKKIKEVRAKQGTVSVTTTVLGGQKVEHKRIKVRPFVTDTATMGVRLGSTIPTGDYASARIDVSVFLPCYVEEALGTLDQCYQVAEKFLVSKLKEVKGEKE